MHGDKLKKNAFVEFLQQHVGNYYKDSILECKLIKKQKLYGFDAGKKHRFLEIKFANTIVMNKVKNIFYSKTKNGRKLMEKGFKFSSSNLYLYEANIPPLLRCFHIQQISPSGWIEINSDQCTSIYPKTTTCNYEYSIDIKDIHPQNDKETSVPYKICSFDIEASSSHGDFPLPIKYYKKLAQNIVDIYDDKIKHDEEFSESILKKNSSYCVWI